MLKVYLEGQAFHPHTSCGLLITQDYIQTLRLLTQQSWVELLIMRAWIDISMQIISYGVKWYIVFRQTTVVILLLPNKSMQEDFILSSGTCL